MAEEVVVKVWEPGIYKDVPFEVYKNIDAINQSVLKQFRRSPGHAREYQLNGLPESESLELGTMLHTCLLEWDRWTKEFIVQPDFTVFAADGVTPKPCLNKDRTVSANPRNTTDFKDRVSAWELKHLGKFEICTAEQKRICDGVAASVAKHKVATELLTSPGENELTIVWQDPETGLLCKARIDRHTMVNDGEVAHTAIIDLKSCGDARPHWFAKNIDSFGYYMQMPFNGWGLAILGRPVSAFYNLAVETSPPYGVGVYRIGQKSLDQGFREIRKYLNDYAECLERDHWPLYPDRIEEIDIPRYSINDIGIE